METLTIDQLRWAQVTHTFKMPEYLNETCIRLEAEDDCPIELTTIWTVLEARVS